MLIILGWFSEVDLRGRANGKLRMAKTNIILKRPVNKLFPIENTYQEPTKQLRQGNKS